MASDPVRVLLVGDDAGMLSILGRGLASVGWTRFAVESVPRLPGPAEAEPRASHDVILVDLSDPERARDDAVAAMRAYAGDRPIVALISPEAAGRRRIPMPEAIDDWLVRDRVDGELLARTLEHAIERRRSAREREAFVQVGRMLVSNVDPKRFAETVVLAVCRLLNATRAHLWQLDARGGDLVCIAAAGQGEADALVGKRLLRGAGLVGAAVAAQRPARSANVLRDPAVVVPGWMREWRGRHRHNAGLAVPLLVDGEPVGGLYAGGETGRVFTDDDAATLTRFADQAAVALENARLHEQAQRQLARTQTLLSVSQALATSVDLTEMLRRIARETSRVLGADTVAAYVASADGTALEPVAAYRVPPELRRVLTELRAPFADHPVFADAWRAARPTLATSASLDARLRDEVFAGYPHASLIVAPMITKGEPVGALVAVWWNAAHGPTERELALIDGVARLGAVAIEDAALYHDAERRRREAETFADLSQTINASLALDAVLDRAVRAAKELTAADFARIVVKQPDGDERFSHWVGDGSEAWHGIAVEPGRGLGGRALATQQPNRTDDYANDPALTKDYLDVIARAGVTAELVAPIKRGGSVEALLYVSNRARRPFTDRDEANLVRIAETAATAIWNAQLFARERRAQQEYRALVEGSIQGIVIARSEAIEFANDAAAGIFGYDAPEDLIGRPFTELLARREDERGFLGDAAPRHGEYQAVRKDGTHVWLDAIASSVAWRGTRATLVTFIDVSERKRAEEALRVTEEQFVHAQKMEAVARLAGGVAHDFNNLLTVVTGRGEMLGAALAHDSALRRHAELIVATAHRASGLVKQLLAFSRRQALAVEVLDLGAVVAMLQPMIEQIAGRSVELVVETDDALGTVSADRSQIEQVIMNLVVNARDAMPDGGRLVIATSNVTLTPRLAAHHRDLAAGRYVGLSVSDTGCGMAPDLLGRIFEPFFTTKPPDKGTGLGLSTVYGIVRQSGGDVSVYSEPGRGSTFRVLLPRADAAEERDGGGAASRDSGIVLVVNAEAATRSLMKDILADEGYTVLEATRPQDALLIAERHVGPIDALITDLTMAEMSGRELFDRVRRSRPGLSAIYTSGYAADAGATADVAADRAVVVKSFALETLARAVRAELDRRE